MSACTAHQVRSVRRHLFVWGLVSTALLAVPAAAQTNFLSATVAWEPSPSTNVSSYLVHYGTRSGIYSTTNSVSGTTTSLLVTNLAPGTTYFAAIKTVNSLGAKSSFSPEVYFTTPSTPKLITKVVTDIYGDSFLEVMTPTIMTRDWTLEYSLDMRSWYPYDVSYGFYAPVDDFVPLYYDFLPQMYFRLAIY